MNYTWDADSKQPKRVRRLDRGVPKAEEQAMWNRYTSLHGMNFPVAVCDYSKAFQRFERVYLAPAAGMPVMLLVDQSGKVQMFRIVHGDGDLKAIEKAVTSLVE